MFDFTDYINNSVFDIKPADPGENAHEFFLKQAREHMNVYPPDEAVLAGAQDHIDVQNSDRSAIEFLQEEIASALQERWDNMPG
ncbi:MAG: hypothetical protein KGL63_05000 [Betaproteobacteria bacterium]|nr:hypothetical protein [Betaproteobacteria bacterium]